MSTKGKKAFCTRQQLSFSSDLFGILIPALHVFWPNSLDITGWCPSSILSRSLASHPKSALMMIAQDSAQFPYSTYTTYKYGDLLCHGVKFTYRLQEPLDKMFLFSPSPPQECSRDAIYRQSVQYHSPIWLYFLIWITLFVPHSSSLTLSSL